MCLGNPNSQQSAKVLSPDARQKDLVGWWKFDDGFGYDSSGNGAHAAPVPQPGPPHGMTGFSAQFNGNDFIAIPNSATHQVRQMSVLFWVFLLEDATGTMRTILRKGSAEDEQTPKIMLQAETNRLHAVVSTEVADKETLDSIAVIPTRRWTHVALLIEGKLMQLYVNGMFDSQVVLKGSTVFNPKMLMVGKELGGPGARMYLDDLRLYSTSLDERHVQAVATGALGPVGPGHVRLGCKGRPCTFDQALSTCPRDYHLCTVKEFYAGALSVVRAQGWFHLSPNVWPKDRKPKDGPDAEKFKRRLAVCCKNNPPPAGV